MRYGVEHVLLLAVKGLSVNKHVHLIRFLPIRDSLRIH